MSFHIKKNEKSLDSLIIIEEKEKNYFWSFDIKDDFLIITISILDKNIEIYQIKKNLENWKKVHFIFSAIQNLKKLKEFFLQSLNRKDIKTKVSENKLILEISIEILYEKQVIPIELTKNEINKDDLIFQLYDTIKNMKNNLDENSSDNISNIKKELESQKNEINNLKEEITRLNKIIKELKELYDILDQNRCYGSFILRSKEEVDLLKDSINQKLGKKVKFFQKLYTASRDGEDAATFHKLCDNKENTISLVKTGGHRRFGGFTTQTWNEVSSFTKTDQYAFVFSLDKLKIYSYTNNGRAIRCDNRYLPTFGVGTCDFRLYDKPISGKNLYTNQSSGDRSYNYNGDTNALSEDGSGNCISTIEVEVYQAIF